MGSHDGRWIEVQNMQFAVPGENAGGGVSVVSGEVFYKPPGGTTNVLDRDYYDDGTAAGQPDIRTGTWITDVTYETGSHLLYQDLLLPY